MIDIVSTLTIYIHQKYTSLSEKMQADLKFYIGCLIYPKHMMSNKLNLCDMDTKALNNSERAKKVRQVKELHSYLYNFSMEKCEKFFESVPLCILFKEYLMHSKSRIEESCTMSKNEQVYHSALKLILIKIEDVLHHELPAVYQDN